MRIATAFAALVLALASPALAQSLPGRNGVTQVQAGTIVYLDPVSMNFIVQNRTAARQFWATRATLFRANLPYASFFDLTMGQRVQVAFHDSGPLEIADVVTF
jgi:hypothetical protein